MKNHKKVVIGVSKSGIPYVVSKSRNVEVVFKQPKKQSLQKKIKTWLYHIKQS